METPVQTAVRLLSTLEDFAEQEVGLLRVNDYAGAGALHERAAPVVQRLGELAADPDVMVVQPRVAALLARREQNRHLLEAQLVRLRSELRRVDEARVRLAGLAPAYSMRAVETHARLNSAA